MLGREKLIKYLEDELERTTKEIKNITDKISEKRELQKDTLAKSIAVNYYSYLINLILSIVMTVLITVGMVVLPINMIGIITGLILDTIFSVFTVSNAKAVIENKKILKGTNYTCSDHNKLWYESLSFAKEAHAMEDELKKLKEQFNECYTTLTEIAYLKSSSSFDFNDDLKQDFEQFINQKVDYCDIDFSVPTREIDINKKMVKKL